MGVASSTSRKNTKSGRTGASASTSRKKIIEVDPVEDSASSSLVNELDPSEISCLIDGSLVYGRQDDKKRIMQLLLSDDCKNRNVNIICIVGADGIGKTTMVQLIYTDKRVEDAFDKRIFIGMYDKFDEKRLMKELLESLTGAQCDITESSILQDIVKDELTGKKLLLVLDSANNEHKGFWVYLLALLNAAAKGTTVLVITSRWEVANVAGAIHSYQLGYLSDYNSWLIFEKLALSVIDQNVKTELINIGKHLINKCASNTLCIKMLGGLLSRSVSIESWSSVLESFSWYKDEAEEDILPVLRVCYENLPSYLKQCFVYCSLFPKGYIFSKNYMTLLWSAQGFIKPVVGKDIGDVSFQCFEELCSRSFLHHSPLRNGNDDMFVMHGLIHDLAQYMSRNVCFRSEDCVEIISKDLHHLSLIPSEYQSVTLNVMIPEAKELQSFLVVSRFMSQMEKTFSPIIDLVGLDALFVKLNSLRVLDLSNTDIEEVPCSIKLLRYLYYVGLSNTKIRSIPEDIGKLINLQTLEAKGCYNLIELPESIHELSNLRHLDVTKEAGFVGIPVGIGKMTNLQSLATFNVGRYKIHCGVEELKYLENLKGCLQICGLENVKSSLDAKEANLKSKYNLENLFLRWSDNTALTEEDEDMELQENILENLEPSENLRELVIRNYLGTQLSVWIGDPSFSKLVSVILDCCPNCSKVPALGTLPLLRYLSLHRLYSVDTMEVSKFPSLEVLNLWEMYELKEWPEIRNDDFPCLRTLSIGRCPMLKSIPRFSCLVELSFHYCPQLPKFAELYSLETLNIEGLSKAKSICLPYNLIVLKKLEISHCNELLSLEGLSKLTSIKMLNITQCPKLDVGDWQPNLSKVANSRLAFEEELDNHDQNFPETKNGKQNDLPITDLQLKNEVEEILAKQKLEEEILKHYTERLDQEIHILERGQHKQLTDEKKLEVKKLISFCRHATKDLELSLGVARGHLYSLETDYMSLWLKEDHASKEADIVPHLKENLVISTSRPLPPVFSKKEVRKATQNFSRSLLIGIGGFGSVYGCGCFLGNTKVAIKKQEGYSLLQGHSEFKQEVDILSRVTHPNIVTLMGVCYDPPCIIYEHLPNGGLDAFLFGTNNTPPLSWKVRTRIIAEICSALIHLHSNNPPIVHRDVKPSNILLDANFMSKLTDFGISRSFDSYADNHVSTRVVGTFGYVDPEYMRNNQLTLKSDVYSFGIVILEIVTRKRNMERGENMRLTDVVEQAILGDRAQFFTLAGDWPFEQAKTLLQLGLRCADFDSNKRPDLVMDVWPIIRSLLRNAYLSVPYCDQFFVKTMQGPNSSQIFQRKLKITEWKQEIEEILVREGQEKDFLEEQIKELRQKMKLLERRKDGKSSKGKKIGVAQPAASSSESETQELEVEDADKLMSGREVVTAASYLPSVTEFSFQELEAATQNFSDAQKIGEGGFGPVYRGSLLYSTVAIKMLRSPSKRGQSEFKQEVAILNKVRHPHLITLFGVCLKPWCLIYEYLPNGSLEDRLACRNNTPPLSWQTRIKIIGEICSTLMFLHSANPHLVIHGDLKPGNILLDANLVCKLSDFGISHLIEDFHATTHTFHFYTQPKGTFAYMDPEFVSTGKLTPESDIYAFGIITLRLVTGKPPLGIARILEEALEGDRMQSLIDKSAGDWPFEQAQILLKIGLRCASLHRRVRPDLVSEVWTTIKPLLEDVSTS